MKPRSEARQVESRVGGRPGVTQRCFTETKTVVLNIIVKYKHVNEYQRLTLVTNFPFTLTIPNPEGRAEGLPSKWPSCTGEEGEGHAIPHRKETTNWFIAQAVREVGRLPPR